MLLKDLRPGEAGIVKGINLPFQIERRLQALGMTLGTKLEIVNRKGQGVMIILLRGTRFALGYNMTRNILVEKAEVDDD